MKGAEITLSDVEHRYGSGGFALSLPSLTVPAGESLGIIGPSGCGKTTLLKLMSGLIAPQHGTITVGGTDVAALSSAGRRAFRIRTIGFVFQTFELLDALDVTENVLLPYYLDASLPLNKETRERAAELATRLGLGDKLRRRVTRLSQGERQRVAIARALVTGPRVVLCDEPTGNLDPANKEHLARLLREQVDREGATLIVVTHDHGLLPHFHRTLSMEELQVATPA